MQLSWLKPKTATLPELEQQAQAATEAHSAALAAVTAAETAFDEDGSDTAAKSLLKSREGAELASVHLGRAQRLLAAGQAKAAAEHRAQLQAKADELRGLLTRPAIQSRIAPLLQRQVELLEQTAACRVELREISDGLSATKRELHGVLLELGGVDHEIKTELGRIEGQIATVTNPVLLSELLKARIPELPAGHLRDRLSELGPQVSTYVRLADRW